MLKSNALVRFFSARPQLKLFLLSALLVILVFPDVVFQNASISMLDQTNVDLKPRSIHTLYKERDNIQPYQGFGDMGGALQSDAAIQFMKYCIRNFQSPYWNPFSGAGSFGPETMVDVKFSPLIFSIALFGGSNSAFHVITILFYILAVFFLATTAQRFLGFSLINSLMTGFIYLLNGYFISNISSNTNQAYLYFPFAIFAVLNFGSKPNVTRYFILILAYILPLSVTFFPTTVLMVLCVTVVALGSSIQYQKQWKSRLALILIQASAPILAVLLLAFIYLPVIDVMKFVGTIDRYAIRAFSGAYFNNVIRVFTPRHVFESYNAMNSDVFGFAGNPICHFGILAGAIAATAVFSRRIFKDYLMASFVFLLFFAFLRIFAVPGFSDLIDYLPLPMIKRIQLSYWWMIVACAFPFVFSYGFNLVEKRQFSLWPSFLTSTIVLADLAYILNRIGILRPVEPTGAINYDQALFYVQMVVFFALAVVLFLYLIRRFSKNSILFTAFAGFIIFEMLFYFHTARYTREDIFRSPPDYVEFLKNNLGEHRIAAYGSSGFPPELGAAYQLAQIDFFTMNIIPSYYRFCQRNLTTEHSEWGRDTFCANRDTSSEPNVNLNSLDLLSVKYMIVAKGWMNKFSDLFKKNGRPIVFENQNFMILENPHVFPRVFGVKNLYFAELTPDTKGRSARALAFTDDEKILLEAKNKAISTEMPLTDQTSELFYGQKLVKYENTEIIIQANFSAPGVLILSDNWHPAWTASVDGKPTYIGRVNESFRGIVLDAGVHTVKMSYWPKYLTLGLIVAGFTMLFLIGLFLRRKKINRKLEFYFSN